VFRRAAAGLCALRYTRIVSDGTARRGDADEGVAFGFRDDACRSRSAIDSLLLSSAPSGGEASLCDALGLGATQPYIP
jgi:hypothetical protein